MHKYRIGKLVDHWVNKTPPIRGGNFPSPDAPVTDCPPFTQATIESQEQASLRSRSPTVPCLSTATTERDTLREKLIQAEIDDGLNTFPSLDVDTQSSIEARYRELHERVISEGFYDCRYLQYAKEIARYSTIFGLFLLTLTNGWYITSAAALGLFWVSVIMTNAKFTDSRSIRLCSPLMMLDIEA